MFQPKVILVIMDGWGYSPIHKGNAIWNAKTPNFDYFWSNYKHTLLNAFGQNVGLPWGAIGGSEVGHASIGSGKLIHQELSLIDKEIYNGNFNKNQQIDQIISKTKQKDKNLHLVGLVSNGGVHSHLSHLYAILEFCKKKKLNKKIYIHAITDGRDTSPKSAKKYLRELEKKIKKIGIDAKIASISGRYYAMDRDSRWDRTFKAYNTITKNTGERFGSCEEAIDKSYNQKIYDEFIVPCVIDESVTKKSILHLFKKKNETPAEKPVLESGDGVIFFNIRPDRMRQLVEMFLFKRQDVKNEVVSSLNVLTLTTYDENLPVLVAYPSEKIKNPLAKILSDNGYKQGHFAETEKYAHVTYFFNGGNASTFKNEVWELVPSPKVATYDLKPEMSAAKITDKVFEYVDKKKLDFVLINYANCDMVGHTGKFDKVVKAVEAVDKEIGRIHTKYKDSILLITADHGNAESMIHPKTGEIDKKHTVNPVPFIIVGKEYQQKSKKEVAQPMGILSDITPTVLNLFNLKKTSEMNGVNLLDSLK